MKVLLNYPLRFTLLFLALALLGAGFWYAARSPEEMQTKNARVERGAVRSFVEVTGRAEPEERIALSFSTSGIIARVLGVEGAKTEAGALIAELDTNTLNARVREADAAVAREEAALDALRAGERAEDIAIKRATKEKTSTALGHSEEELLGVIERGFVLSEGILRGDADALFENADTANPDFGITLTYSGASYTLKADADTEVALTIARRAINKNMPLWRALSTSSNVPRVHMEADARAALGYLGEMQDFISKLSTALSLYTESSPNAQTAFSSYLSSLSTARTTLSSLLSETRTALEALSAARAADTLAARELTRSLAGATQEDIRAQEARLASARAQSDAARSVLSDASLFAPRAGVVSDIVKKEREFTGMGETVAVLDAGEGAEVVAYVPESDVAHLALGNKATGTFDAFDSSEKFSFTVRGIASAETLREGVATYKTTLILDVPDTRIKPGMTADLSILVAERVDTLFIPSRALRREGDILFVLIPNDSGGERRKVTVGLRGSDGFTEILSGLSEGEEVEM